MPVTDTHAISQALAAGAPVQELDRFVIAMGLFGGLALFLFGMEQMASSLKAVAGDRMRSVLAALTKNRFLSVVTGAFVTAVIQSSSVTTVLVVGFISAGLMTMAQSVGVIMGANIGTTITAQIVAFKVTQYAMLMIAAGFALLFIGRKERTQHYGTGLFGLGMIFLGMSVMGDAMQPLRTYAPFLEWMGAMETPIYGIAAGAAFTALIQSSSATTGVVIVMAGQGLISLNAGIALSFGANVGTCVTALLAAIGKPREALRAAMVHVVFNILGVLMWIFFIGHLADVVRWITPGDDARAGAEVPRQIANAHSIFNVLNTVVLIWFSTLIARFVQLVIPDRPLVEARAVRAKYLDTELLSTPALALDRARLQLLQMGEHVREMLAAAMPAVIGGDRVQLREVERMDDTVDILHGKVVHYLGQISQQSLSEAQTEELVRLLEATNSLEAIGDIIETNLVGLGNRRLDSHVRISEPTERVLVGFHRAVLRAFDESLVAVTQRNERAALEVARMKAEIARVADSAALHESRRLVASAPNRLEAYSIETDILGNLRRVYYYCKRMARVSVSPAGNSPASGGIERSVERSVEEDGAEPSIESARASTVREQGSSPDGLGGSRGVTDRPQ